jgi:hypothetical protein
VNALLGEKRARTGDAPETKEAHAYSLQDFDVLDLPGREARLAEQDEAHRALGRAHAALYVVSSQTGLDYETLWRDLAELAGGSTPFLLVVNDKQPHQDDTAESEFRAKVLGRYLSAASGRLGSSPPSPFWIHAGRAERGRLDDKPALVERSGIALLEAQLARYLYQHEAFLRDLAKLRPLADELGALQEDLTGKVNDPASRNTAEALQKVDALREQLIARAATTAEERFGAVRDVVAGILHRNIVAPGSSTKRETVAKEIQEVIETALASGLVGFESACATDFASLQGWLDERLPEAKIDRKPSPHRSVGGIPAGDASPFDIVAAARRVLGVAASAGLVPETVKQGAKRAGIAIAEGAAARGGAALALAGAEGAAKAGAEGALKAGAEEAGKGAVKGLGRLAGGVVVVAVAIWEIASAYKNAERQDKALAAALQQAEGQAGLVASTLKDDFKTRAHQMVGAVLGGATTALRARLEKASKDKRSAESAVVEVSALRARLDMALERLAASSRA